MSDPHYDDTFKEVVPFDESARYGEVDTAKEATVTSPSSSRSPDRSPESAPQVLDTLYIHDSKKQDEEQQEQQKGAGKKYTFTRKRLIIICIILLAVIAAIIGGAVGGTVGRKKSAEENADESENTGENDSGDSSTPDDNPSENDENEELSKQLVLSNSSIAAANWTDNNGSDFHGVFWQTSANDLFMSVWRSDTFKWSVTNISSETSTSVKAGSPLAVAVRALPWTEEPYEFGDFGIALFYINTDGVLTDIYSDDPEGTSWQPGELSEADTEVTMGDDTQLAVRWDLCGTDNCRGDLLVVYQDEENNVRLYNSSDPTREPDTITDSLPGGSPLAMTAINPRDSESVDSWDAASSIKLYSATEDGVQEYVWDFPGPWEHNEDIIYSDFPEDPRLAAVAFQNEDTPELGLVNVLLTFTYDDGFTLASVWDNETWSDPQTPGFTEKEFRSFSTGAMINGRRNIKYYGLAEDGTLQSMTPDRENPTTWDYDEPVAIKDDE